MKKESILCAAAAAVFALGAAAPLGVCAEETEEEAIEFTYDADKLTDSKEPALSFDSSGYESYIHMTRDAEKGGISFEQDKDTSYQGVSLKILADTKGVSGYFNGSGFVKDENNNSLYPDAPDVEDVINLNFVGIELRSEDFGLSTFDGCLFNFAYRLTAEDEGALLGDTVWVYSANSDNVRKCNPLELTVNTVVDDNVNQYNGNALVSVPEASNSTKLIFDIPVQKEFKGEVLYLDNITISLPDSAEGKYVANVDGYNKNAKISERVDEIKISKDKNDTTIADKKIEKEKDHTKKRIVILVIVIVAAAAAGGVVAFIMLKKRFY